MNDARIAPRATEEQSAEIIAAMPKDLLAEHIKFAGGQEKAYWASGELSIKLQELYYPEYSKAAIRKVVGEIYSISINTVRDRERVAEAVPDELRNALEFLKFSHWRNIIPAGQKRANSIVWESVAMYEAEGKGPTVDQILSWRDSKTLDATPPWIYRYHSGMEKLEMVRDDARADPRLRLLFENTIREAEEITKGLKLERFQLIKDGENGTENA